MQVRIQTSGREDILEPKHLLKGTFPHQQRKVPVRPTQLNSPPAVLSPYSCFEPRLLMVMEELDNFTFYSDYYIFEHFNPVRDTYGKPPQIDPLTIVQVVAALIYSLTCLLGLLGNGLVIAIIFKMKKSVTTIWFLNLAAADFLFNVFLPLNITYTAMGFHWVFGRDMCKVSTLLLNLNMCTSVLLLTTISIDRCILVVFPVQSQKRRTPTIAWLFCILIWVFGFLMSSPSRVFRDTTTTQDHIRCFYNFSLSSSPNDTALGVQRHKMVTTFRFLTGFIIPMIVITACYITIIFRLKKNRLAKSKKPLKIIVAIITIFFLCWCPYHTLHLLETDHRSVPENVFEIGLPLVTAIAASNSCMNPILYVFMGQDFKKFKVTILSRLANALTEDTINSIHSFSRKSVTKASSMTEKESILL
ncbi:chemokine-like receptor 1 isoform X1 [Crotalus tigris]|uniref:chemokine-like receptor 1 isoform X1 n=2 Tax=Crotalus tigris TaxID=88082 RepID=UPI00192F615B|nr:chemokine-like receptor 1 isoform X1 [Crotalus tigris]